MQNLLRKLMGVIKKVSLRPTRVQEDTDVTDLHEVKHAPGVFYYCEGMGLVAVTESDKGYLPDTEAFWSIEASILAFPQLVQYVRERGIKFERGGYGGL